MTLTETIRKRLGEIDDPARWLGFLGTAVEQGMRLTDAAVIADEAYVNDFPPEVQQFRIDSKALRLPWQGTKAKKQEGGRWITIGAREGDDGKRRGGSPVYIEGGRITRGHPSLTGKKVGALDQDADHGTHRQQLRQSRDYDKASWAKKAKKAGINADALHDLHDLADDFLRHDTAFKTGLDEMMKYARKLSEKLGYGSLSNLRHRNARGNMDADSVEGLDDVAARVVERFPEYFSGDSDLSSQLYDRLIAGKPDKMTADEAYEEAFDYLEGMKVGDEEAVPF